MAKVIDSEGHIQHIPDCFQDRQGNNYQSLQRGHIDLGK